MRLQRSDYAKTVLRIQKRLDLLTLSRPKSLNLLTKCVDGLLKSHGV